MKFQLNRLAAALALAAAGAVALPAQAAPAPSENATVNLIRLLVQQGVIKQDQADALVAQAEAEAKSARATGNDRGAAVAQAGDVRVPYILQTVRDQIRDEVKAEVMTQAKEENWAQPNTFPTGFRASRSRAMCACATSRACTRAATATKSPISRA